MYSTVRLIHCYHQEVKNSGVRIRRTELRNFPFLDLHSRPDVVLLLSFFKMKETSRIIDLLSDVLRDDHRVAHQQASASDLCRALCVLAPTIESCLVA